MQDWARIMAPLSGGEGDRRVLAAAAALAEPFGAELACVHAPADVADLIPWMGDGFMGGVQATAVQSLREAAAAGEKAARASAEAAPYANKTFTALSSPVWAALAMEGRVSDVVVFDFPTARGKGALSEAFQQILADEQRPTLVAQEGLAAGGVVAVAWDGGKEASRAARTAIPLLRKASAVVILAAPSASPRRFDPAILQGFLAARGVQARTEVLGVDHGDPAPALIKGAKSVSASILVAGAFGHPRLQEYVFGGATRTFLHSEELSLFLSH
jgi:nucleotide-binding universal stress UspA family protein